MASAPLSSASSFSNGMSVDCEYEEERPDDHIPSPSPFPPTNDAPSWHSVGEFSQFEPIDAENAQENAETEAEGRKSGAALAEGASLRTQMLQLSR